MFTRHSFLSAKDNSLGIFALQNALLHKEGPWLKCVLDAFQCYQIIFLYGSVKSEKRDSIES